MVVVVMSWLSLTEARLPEQAGSARTLVSTPQPSVKPSRSRQRVRNSTRRMSSDAVTSSGAVTPMESNADTSRRCIVLEYGSLGKDTEEDSEKEESAMDEGRVQAERGEHDGRIVNVRKGGRHSRQGRNEDNDNQGGKRRTRSASSTRATAQSGSSGSNRPCPIEEQDVYITRQNVGACILRARSPATSVVPHSGSITRQVAA